MQKNVESVLKSPAGAAHLKTPSRCGGQPLRGTAISARVLAPESKPGAKHFGALLRAAAARGILGAAEDEVQPCNRDAQHSDEAAMGSRQSPTRQNPFPGHAVVEADPKTAR
jgi:hypothetical protein